MSPIIVRADAVTAGNVADARTAIATYADARTRYSADTAGHFYLLARLAVYTCCLWLRPETGICGKSDCPCGPLRRELEAAGK